MVPDGDTKRRKAVRGVLLTPDGFVLLMRLEEPVTRRQFWITPGGAIEPGESAETCLRRELREETGIREAQIGPLMWKRDHEFEWNGRKVSQHEAYYLVVCAQFEPTMEGNPASGELSAFRGFRWWSAEEIRNSGQLFAPRRLAELLDTLVHDGPPKSPFDVGV